MGDVYIRSNLPPYTLEKVRMLQERLRVDKYDAQAWEQLMEELRQYPLSTELRAAYEDLLSVFPTAASYWTRYAELEMSANNQGKVKSIFSRCLLNCPSVELWAAYLKFIKKVNESKGPDGLLEVKKAYEFTLDCIGQDVHAGTLWQEFANFMQAPKPGTAAYSALFSTGAVGQEEAHRLTLLRRVYQRAIVVPTHQLDVLWRLYEALESANTNKQLVRRVLEEQRARYHAARQALRERRRRMDLLRTSVLALPPGRGGAEALEQARLWREYIEFERSNPQRLDPATLTQRVSLAFDQCLMCLWHYPEVWYDYARFHSDGTGGVAQAVLVLGKATKAVPGCLMLRFALADFEESQGHIDKAKQVYEDMAQQMEAEGGPTVNGGGVDGGAPVPPVPPPAEGAMAPWPFGPELGALVWIQYMRFSRRSENVKASRKLFLRAKKWRSCPWHVYVASALMEWRHAREPNVARKIFEKGLEDYAFLTDPHFILQYLDFLMEVGDVANARALFERVLTEEVNRSCAVLWHRYLALEYDMGDLAGAVRLERRARDALGDSASEAVRTLLLRYGFAGVWPCTPAQRIHLEHAVLGGVGGDPATAALLGGLGGLGAPAPPPLGQPSQGPPSFQIPPAIGHLMSLLPPVPDDGPLAPVDLVIHTAMTADLTPGAVLAAIAELEGRTLPPPTAPGTSPYPYGGPGASPGMTPARAAGDDVTGVKRPLEDDEDEEGGGAFAAFGDLYRQRVKQRIRAGGTE